MIKVKVLKRLNHFLWLINGKFIEMELEEGEIRFIPEDLFEFFKDLEFKRKIKCVEEVK